MEAYSKNDAKMTQGFAILCMLVLHLFCRTGDSVLGTPLIWITAEKPLVYCFGFFAEICVPIYSICAGYARQLKKDSTYEDNLSRVLKLLKNYWIILCLFSVIGLIFGGAVPGNLKTFLANIVLVKSYQGAWWYLNTYVLLLLIPNAIILFPMKKIGAVQGVVYCVVFQVGWYFIGRFGVWPEVAGNVILDFTLKEVKNMLGVLPYFWIGAFFQKGRLIDEAGKKLEQYVRPQFRNVILFVVIAVWFMVFNILHKVVLVGVVSIVSFLTFVLIKKPIAVKNSFMSLGKHSTNIWLTHMFFYCTDPFDGLVQKARYPLLMLLFMLVLCIGTSYAVFGISALVDRIGKGICLES